MSYLDTYKKKRSSSRGGDTTIQSDRNNSEAYKQYDSYSRDHNDDASGINRERKLDDKHKQMMRENKLRLKRLDEENQRKKDEEEKLKVKTLEEKKKNQKHMYEKYFKPNNNNADRVLERSLRYLLLNRSAGVD